MVESTSDGQLSRFARLLSLHVYTSDLGNRAKTAWRVPRGRPDPRTAKGRQQLLACMLVRLVSATTSLLYACRPAEGPRAKSSHTCLRMLHSLAGGDRHTDAHALHLLILTSEQYIDCLCRLCGAEPHTGQRFARLRVTAVQWRT